MGETDDLEWDDAKAASNLAKHAVPLELAPLLFDGRLRVERQSIKSPGGEVRFEVVAEIGGRLLFGVYTWTIRRRRAISLRQAHRSERRAYEQAVAGRADAARGFRLVESRRDER